MARIITNQRNLWGAQSEAGGVDPQRSDLWVADFRAVTTGIATALTVQVPILEPYYVQSLTLPSLSVGAEVYRRDSRPYQMPVFDDALEGIRMTFILDSRTSVESSRIYRLLSYWRRLVRAGRGSLGTEEEINLPASYLVTFRFPIYLMLLKGAKFISNRALDDYDSFVKAGNENKSSGFSFEQLKRKAQESKEAFEQRVAALFSKKRAETGSQVLRGQIHGAKWEDLTFVEDFQIAGYYILEKCWLKSFKINELSYSQSQVASIEAEFMAENILDNAEALGK